MLDIVPEWLLFDAGNQVMPNLGKLAIAPKHSIKIQTPTATTIVSILIPKAIASAAIKYSTEVEVLYPNLNHKFDPHDLKLI